jgi:hypothetical protein
VSDELLAAVDDASRMLAVRYDLAEENIKTSLLKGLDAGWPLPSLIRLVEMASNASEDFQDQMAKVNATLSATDDDWVRLMARIRSAAQGDGA